MVQAKGLQFSVNLRNWMRSVSSLGAVGFCKRNDFPDFQQFSRAAEGEVQA